MKVLVISQSEFSYNVRVLKAVKFFKERGDEVVILNGIIGLGDQKVYNRLKDELNCTVYENVIDKRNWKSYTKWLICSLSHKSIYTLWSYFSLRIGYKYILNKSLMYAPKVRGQFSLIYVNLVDSLPLAIDYKLLSGAKYLIYDSQEYFKGQYSKYEKAKFDWVERTEALARKHVDIVLGTTSVMVENLRTEFPAADVYRVRNLPYQISQVEIHDVSNNPLKLIWHGMSVHYGNCRGLHVVIESISKSKNRVDLYIQGKLVEPDYSQIVKIIRELGIEECVHFVESAPPDRIVESLIKYDVGVTGELPEEENQKLTSSNKMFEYIHAGLAVISSDLPGLRETLVEYEVGLLYEAGNTNEFAQCIDKLAEDRIKLQAFKQNSRQCTEELIWKNDFQNALQSLREK